MGKATLERYGRTYPFDYDRRHSLSLVSTWRFIPKIDLGATLRVDYDFGLGRDGNVGDLLVTIDVHVPAELSETARKALEDFAAAAPPAPRERLDAIAQEQSSHER